MSSLSRSAIDALLPEGIAWSPAADDDYDLLLEGIADNSEAVRLDLDKLRYLRDPARTPILDDLEREFAVIPSATASEAERRIRLASTMFRRSELPTYEMLEDKLQGAGFDCYVYPNDPAVDPSLYLEQNFNMVCGGLLPGGNEAQCGEAEAYCAQVGGELLGGGEIFDTFPDYNCLCGEPLMQCGEADALCGSYTGILLIPIEYPIPDNSGYWPLIFFVGGLREWGLLGSRYSFQGCNSGVDGTYVYNSIIQPDGKILICGFFNKYNGISRNNIARLNSNGSLDTSFDPGSGANNVIYEIALQSDGKILIGGLFTSYDGTARNYIARLNADGSLDATFDPGTGANHYITALALQSDGKILIGGAFTIYDGTNRNRIARLDDDGSLDATFDPGAGANSYITALALQSDGKILIGGMFTDYDGTAINHIARIEDDGDIDATFGVGTGANSAIYSIALQSDGKILIGGLFTSYDGTARNYIARLDDDGSLDATFDPGSGANNYVFAITIQTDGKILIGGQFTTFDGDTANRLARLNTDGELDIVDVYGWSIASAQIAIERRQEFRRIILKSKPMASWAGLIVVYI